MDPSNSEAFRSVFLSANLPQINPPKGNLPMNFGAGPPGSAEVSIASSSSSQSYMQAGPIISPPSINPAPVYLIPGPPPGPVPQQRLQVSPQPMFENFPIPNNPTYAHSNIQHPPIIPAPPTHFRPIQQVSPQIIPQGFQQPVKPVFPMPPMVASPPENYPPA